MVSKDIIHFVRFLHDIRIPFSPRFALSLVYKVLLYREKRSVSLQATCMRAVNRQPMFTARGTRRAFSFAVYVSCPITRVLRWNQCDSMRLNASWPRQRSEPIRRAPCLRQSIAMPPYAIQNLSVTPKSRKNHHKA